MLHLWLGILPAEAAAPGFPLRAPCLPAATLIDETIAAHRYLAYGWPVESAGSCAETFEDQHRLWAGPAAPAARSRSRIAPHLRIDRRGGAVTAILPATSTVPLFCAAARGGLWVATDPRWLPADNSSLDARGLYALLQFGAIPAPFTLWPGIRRLTPGTQTRFVPGAPDPIGVAVSAASGTSPTTPHTMPRHAARKMTDLDARADYVGEILDALLEELCPDRRPAILFSGGVDSGLLAARCARLGWRDALLVCYRLHQDDPQPRWATQMAAELGLRLRIVPEHPPDWATILRAMSAAYPEPVGDFGAPAAYDLTGRLADLVEDRQTVLDGSGADALFRTFPALPRWRRLYALPRPLRRAAGALWPATRGWRATHRASRWLAAARISAEMPYELGSMIAENALAHRAYAAPKAVRSEVQAALAGNLSLAFGNLSRPLRSRALDLLHVVCALTVQKNAPLFLGSKLDLIHPFLHPDLVDVAFAWADAPAAREASKEVLKRLLTRDLPGALVEQPKRGMTPDMREILAQPEVARTMAAAAQAAPECIADGLDLGLLRQILRASRSGRPLPHATYNFLWTACATLLWLGTQPPRGELA